MNQRMWSGRILLKYCLIQLPGIAVVFLLLMLVRQWVAIPPGLTWGLIGLWVAKDVIFYPFVWRAYDWGNPKDRNPMIGLCGITKDRLNPSGYISVRGELWKARVIEEGRTIEKGENVLVQGAKGLTLLVGHETEGKGF